MIGWQKKKLRLSYQRDWLEKKKLQHDWWKKSLAQKGIKRSNIRPVTLKNWFIAKDGITIILIFRELNKILYITRYPRCKNAALKKT